MGHYHDDVIGVGTDKDDALQNALLAYRSEHGYHVDIREVESALQTESRLPMKWVKDTGPNSPNSWWSTKQVPDYDYTGPWLQVWQFTLHVHA